MIKGFSKLNEGKNISLLSLMIAQDTVMHIC